jgi:hypothetical protein
MSVTTTIASFTDFEKTCVQLAGIVYSKTPKNRTAIPVGWSLGRYVSDNPDDGSANQDSFFLGSLYGWYREGGDLLNWDDKVSLLPIKGGFIFLRLIKVTQYL